MSPPTYYDSGCAGNITLHIDFLYPLLPRARRGRVGEGRGAPSSPSRRYGGRVRETGTGARTAPVAAALRAAASRSFQTTPCRPLVRPAVDVIAPSLVIYGKVKQLSPPEAFAKFQQDLIRTSEAELTAARRVVAAFRTTHQTAINTAEARLREATSRSRELSVREFKAAAAKCSANNFTC